jgi:hypothetical protein
VLPAGCAFIVVWFLYSSVRCTLDLALRNMISKSNSNYLNFGVISVFCRSVNEIVALLGCYAAYQFTLCHIPEKQRSYVTYRLPLLLNNVQRLWSQNVYSETEGLWSWFWSISEICPLRLYKIWKCLINSMEPIPFLRSETGRRVMITVSFINLIFCAPSKHKQLRISGGLCNTDRNKKHV